MDSRRPKIEGGMAHNAPVFPSSELSGALRDIVPDDPPVCRRPCAKRGKSPTQAEGERRLGWVAPA